MSVINIDVLKKFLESQYARHLIFKTDNVEVLLLCWLPGQGADIHEHGQSDAITLVLDGKLSYTNFYPDGTKVSGVLLPGDIEHISPGVKHQVINNSNENLVTLHFYSPPLALDALKDSLGYANKVKLQEVQLLEKTVRYLVGEKSNDYLTKSKNGDSLTKSFKSRSAVFKKMDRITIAVIGGGFSGTLVAAHLMKKNSSTPVQIMLIERAPKFARGFAYSTNSPMHLLNVPASKMSAFPDDSNHFLVWAQKRDPSIQANTFVPRMLYGEYLETVLHEAELNKASNIGFKRLSDEAVSIDLHSCDSMLVHLQSGIQLPVNFVVLAVGNYLPRNPRVVQNLFYKSKRYIRDPWSHNSLSMISPDDPVLLVGTGLTMVDKAVELKCRGHRGAIYAISRHGLLPQPHDLDIKNLGVNIKFKKPVTVNSLLQLVRSEAKKISSLGGNWREVIDALRPEVQKLWMSLEEAEKLKFFRHLRPYWETHRHRMAPQVASIINSMIELHQLKIFSGRIKDYKEDKDHVNVVILERGQAQTKTLQVVRVINCTGSEIDFCQIEDPLIVNLLEQGIITPDKLSLGLEAASSGALIDKNKNISSTFFTLGPPLKGALWETTAVPEIREQASSLAKLLISKADLLMKEYISSGEELLPFELEYVI